MRVLFLPVLVSSILLAPVAYGNSLQPRPPGSIPSDYAIILTFASSADTLSSYVVDHQGFSVTNFERAPNSTQIGGSIANDDTSNHGFSSSGLSGDAFKPKDVNGGTGSFSGGAGSSFSSSGGRMSDSTSLSLASGTLWSNGLGKRSDFDMISKGVGFLAVLPNSEPGSFALGSERFRDAGPSVGATPLPASWTMMLIGLLAFGGLACFRKLKASSTRPPTVSLATQ